VPSSGPIVYGRGLEISGTLEDSSFEGVGLTPLALVLEQFFARYASINSFTPPASSPQPRRDQAMAGPDRQAADTVGATIAAALRAQPRAFTLFIAALRALEALYPDQPRLGESVRPGEERECGCRNHRS
jgi:hypothetical protein